MSRRIQSFAVVMQNDKRKHSVFFSTLILLTTRILQESKRNLNLIFHSLLFVDSSNCNIETLLTIDKNVTKEIIHVK